VQLTCVFFVIKPVVDLFWAYKISVAGFNVNPGSLFGVVLEFLSVIGIPISSNHTLYKALDDRGVLVKALTENRRAR